MIITCPNCETRFNVNPAALVPDGRAVKCMRCGHTWTERPPQEARPRPAAAAAAAAVERTLRVEDLPKTDDDVDDVPDFGERPAVVQRKRRAAAARPGAAPNTLQEGRRSAVGQLIAAVVVVAIVAALIGGSFFVRDSVVALWPPAGALYERVGFAAAKPGDGLEIRNIKSTQKVENDKPAIAITGEIANRTQQPIEIPGLRGALLDVREREVFVWTFTAGSATLEPGKTIEFDTVVSEPPPSARRIAIAFFEEKKK